LTIFSPILAEALLRESSNSSLHAMKGRLSGIAVRVESLERRLARRDGCSVGEHIGPVRVPCSNVFNFGLTTSGNSRTNEGMSTDLSSRPVCPTCNSSKVGTLAKEIRTDTAWRCASCGVTFKAPRQDNRAMAASEYSLPPRMLKI
jgi:ribosomal protein L37AE/L43A